MKKYIQVITILLVVVVIISFLIWREFSEDQKPLPGYIEANLTYISANNVSGALKKLMVSRGQEVKKGQLLFTIDPTQYQLQRLADQQNYLSKKASYEDLLTAKRKPYIDQAKADIEEEKANLIYLEKSYERSKALLADGNTSKEDYDLSKSQYEQARKSLSSLEQQLSIYKLKKGRENEIVSAKKSMDMANAEVQLANWNVAQTKVTSPQHARVFDTYYWPGEQVQAFSPVLSLLVPNQIKLIFYVSEKALHRIKLGERVSFQIDGVKKTFLAEVSFISPEAEYTPPVIYSENAREDLSYRIEAKIMKSQENIWHPGQPVSVYLSSEKTS
ncbi:HlyD family secretion protein [Fangia hongkongensis]|uniref:HlyD family secretion protein n=1 Tax=Fangia hongkongensis TaxID=270495 RepID=UPI000364C207|nr:biotin/lipoyl-binding protein [Fangia hongkongensis]MBK2126026.1 HlyD family efflux transporter periplasmic adaptor subunit [Fangia hongkongensis]